MASRLWRAARRRARRLIHGPNRIDIPRELWREGVFLLAGRFRETLSVRWPAGTFVVSTRDYDVSRRTFVSGPYGLERLLRVGGLVELAGREVLEIGANIGTTTVPLVTVLNAARVHACEPVTRNLALLERNVLSNGLRDRVTIHRTAVSDRVGTLNFSLADRYWGSSRVAAEGEPATATTIDALLATESRRRSSGAMSRDTRPRSSPVQERSPSPDRDRARPNSARRPDSLHSEIARRAGQLIDLVSGQPVSLEGLGTTDLLILPSCPPRRLPRAPPSASSASQPCRARASIRAGGPQREQADDERGERHDAHLAAQDRHDDRLLLGPRQRRDRLRVAISRAVSTWSAATSGSCSATKPIAIGSSA